MENTQKIKHEPGFFSNIVEPKSTIHSIVSENRTIYFNRGDCVIIEQPVKQQGTWVVIDVSDIGRQMVTMLNLNTMKTEKNSLSNLWSVMDHMKFKLIRNGKYFFT